MNKVGEKIEELEFKSGRRFSPETLISQLYAGGRSKVWSWGFNGKNLIFPTILLLYGG